MWAKCDDHVLKIEEDDWKTAMVAYSTIQSVVNNLEPSESDSEESDKDLDVMFNFHCIRLR